MERIITSLQNNLIKEAVKLKQKKYRNLNSLFLVEGHHLVNEALTAGFLRQIFYLDTLDFPFNNAFQVSESVMKKLTEVNSPQGIIGVCDKPEKMVLSDKIILLDNVQDPGNIGTLIRSAAAWGFDTIIADNSVDFYNEKVIRSSQGAIFKVSLINQSIVDFIYNNQDYQLFATDLLSKKELKDLNLDYNKIGIILGNEGTGISKEVLNLVPNKFKIKMKNMESLNVGVAGSVIMYEIFKRSDY